MENEGNVPHYQETPKQLSLRDNSDPMDQMTYQSRDPEYKTWSFWNFFLLRKYYRGNISTSKWVANTQHTDSPVLSRH